MSNKQTPSEEGIKDQQEQQLVYMMPHQDFDEDEIDLWQLFLPLIKYKVQIFLFLIVGLVIGFGYPRYKKPQAQAVEPVNTILARLSAELDTGMQDLFSLIDQTPAEGKQLLITDAEYQYTTIDNPGKVRTIRLDTYRDLKKTPVATWIEPHNLILTIESLPTLDLVRQLKNAYSESFSLGRELLVLNQNRKIRQINAYTKTNGIATPTGDSENDSNGSRSNLIGKTRMGQKALQARIQLLHETLSDPVYFEFRHNRIPWTIWKDIKSQLKEEKEEKEEKIYQDIIKKRAETLEHVITEISKYRMMNYLITNNLNLPAERFSWPAVTALQALRYPAAAPVKTGKFLLISVAIALFLGIFSVYLRIFTGNLSRGDGFEKQKQELIKALKYWKL